MKDDGLKTRIYNYLKNLYSYNPDRWLNVGEIEDLAKGAGFLGGTASRRARELAKEGLLEVKRFKASSTSRVKTAHYHYKDPLKVNFEPHRATPEATIQDALNYFKNETR